MNQSNSTQTARSLPEPLPYTGPKRISQSQHIDILNRQSEQGKYWYDADDITAERPYIGIDKTGPELRSEAFATQAELFAWFDADTAKASATPLPSPKPSPAPSKPVTPVVDTPRPPARPVDLTTLHFGANDLYGQQRAELQQKLSGVLDKVAERLDLSVGRDEIPEFPADLVKQLTAEKITKSDVENILAVFQGHISIPQIQTKARAIVVVDEGDEKGMKDARELRLAIRQVRLRLTDLIALDKDEHHRKWQVYTGVIRLVKDLFEDEEGYLQEQEDFAKNAEQTRRLELRNRRLDQLMAVQFENPHHLDLSDYSDEAFATILKTATDAYAAKVEVARRAEEDRIARERRQERRAGRIRMLSGLGITYDGAGAYVYHSFVRIPESTIDDDATDEVFTATVENARPIIEHEVFLDQRLKARSQDLYGLGFRPSAAGATFVWGDEQYSLSLKDARDLSDDEWQTTIGAARLSIESIKAKAATDKAESERLAREERERLERERAETARQRDLEVAPDREQLEAWARQIEAMRFSGFLKSAESKEILSASLGHLGKVAERIRERIATL